ncbi:sigma-70 family RNA polymerase sigma factor [Echinicola marina]|uniref:sigma-70 family RNA polymerase sigma factor n=1 Tax=Echinicola marina TaxID=2859768 RepID=UPI001CF6421D|nr:sigma-70 family RNA polymerase sigma factor [Echinicola marina]UCS93280.1 sigma-70 family RNA polymerase sigma factor [Echinicola marina]
MNDWKKYENMATRELIDIFQDPCHINREEAFYVLVYRFRQDLLNFCEIRCKNFGQSFEVAEELVHSVFESYAKKPGFNIENSKGKNDDDSFLIYLIGIAKNRLVDIYRIQKKKQDGKWSDGSESLITKLPELPYTASPESKMIYKIISSLPYSHRVIYLTYIAYENAGCNLPRKLLKELRDHLNIEQSTIRGYKKEAMDKINIAKEAFRTAESEKNEIG